MQSLEAKKEYKNAFHCASRIIKEEGVSKLWKGTTPRLGRLVVSCRASAFGMSTNAFFSFPEVSSSRSTRRSTPLRHPCCRRYRYVHSCLQPAAVRRAGLLSTREIGKTVGAGRLTAPTSSFLRQGMPRHQRVDVPKPLGGTRTRRGRVISARYTLAAATPLRCSFLGKFWPPSMCSVSSPGE